MIGDYNSPKELLLNSYSSSCWPTAQVQPQNLIDPRMESSEISSDNDFFDVTLAGGDAQNLDTSRDQSVFGVVEDLLEERDSLHLTILILAMTTILLLLVLLGCGLAICFCRLGPGRGREERSGRPVARRGRRVARRRSTAARRVASLLLPLPTPSPSPSMGPYPLPSYL